MSLSHLAAICAALFALSFARASASQAGNPETGRQLFRACAACHSQAPGRQVTFRGLSNAAQSHDVIAFLKRVCRKDGATWGERPDNMHGGAPAAIGMFAETSC